VNGRWLSLCRIGAVEVREHQDMEQPSEGSGAERVEPSLESVLQFVGAHVPEVTRSDRCTHKEPCRPIARVGRRVTKRRLMRQSLRGGDEMDNSKQQRTTIPQTEQEWRTRLTPEQYEVLRNKGTEQPFTGAYASTKEPGVYRCAGCGAALFSSSTKYESGTGWPSFWEPIEPGAVELHDDRTLWMHRTEVTCARCGGHLGHVFSDGPRPTGDRYCMNSVSLELEPESREE
jgi:peptide-methionine (R)-S-oxide reductase